MILLYGAEFGTYLDGTKRPDIQRSVRKAHGSKRNERLAERKAALGCGCTIGDRYTRSHAQARAASSQPLQIKEIRAAPATPEVFMVSGACSPARATLV